MIRSSTSLKVVALFVAVGLPLVIASPVFAVSGDISQVENFIRSIITLLSGYAGLVATGFFVLGGFTYITSSGNPEVLGTRLSAHLFYIVGCWTRHSHRRVRHKQYRDFIWPRKPSGLSSRGGLRGIWKAYTLSHELSAS